jgi:hypothetical protein
MNGDAETEEVLNPEVPVWITWNEAEHEGY